MNFRISWIPALNKCVFGHEELKHDFDIRISIMYIYWNFLNKKLFSWEGGLFTLIPTRPPIIHPHNKIKITFRIIPLREYSLPYYSPPDYFFKLNLKSCSVKKCSTWTWASVWFWTLRKIIFNKKGTYCQFEQIFPNLQFLQATFATVVNQNILEF